MLKRTRARRESVASRLLRRQVGASEMARRCSMALIGYFTGLRVPCKGIRRCARAYVRHNIGALLAYILL